MQDLSVTAVQRGVGCQIVAVALAVLPDRCHWRGPCVRFVSFGDVMVVRGECTESRFPSLKNLAVRTVTVGDEAVADEAGRRLFGVRFRFW